MNDEGPALAGLAVPTMVEKVARAMWERHKGSDQSWHTLGSFWKNTYLEKAHAAIAAIELADRGDDPLRAHED